MKKPMRQIATAEKTRFKNQPVLSLASEDKVAIVESLPFPMSCLHVQTDISSSIERAIQTYITNLSPNRTCKYGIVKRPTVIPAQKPVLI